jgi:hypothetical protein
VDAVVRRSALLADHHQPMRAVQVAFDRGLDEAMADHPVPNDKERGSHDH